MNIRMKLLIALFLSLLMHCSGLEKTSDWNISETFPILPDLVNTSEMSTSDTSVTVSDLLNTSDISSPGLVNGAELSSSVNIFQAEDCDYTTQSFCGDVCIEFGSNCICGDGQQFRIGIEYEYCCLEEKLSEKQCYVGNWKWGYCKSGRTMPRSETCNSHCYNEYTGNKTSLGPYANFKCKSNDQCVPVRNLCNGVYYCPDKSDVEICNSDIQCASTSAGFTKYDIHSTIVTQHSECGYHDLDNDGEYDTISRRDETNLNVVTQTGRNIDYTTLQNCTDKNGLSGLTCDGISGGCLPNYLWCRNDRPGSCNNNSFSTNDKSLCGNTTFWRTQSCDIINSGEGGVTYGFGQRCSGAVQHCFYTWYSTENIFYEVGLRSLFEIELFSVSAQLIDYAIFIV